jgi:undecaprenyl-diphosphatase
MSKILTCLAICVVLQYGTALAADSTQSAAPVDGSKNLHWSNAVVLGIVEGVTEYLPVSSTGHLLLTERIMGMSRTSEAREAADAYAIIIQIGAIFAVFGIYRKRILEMIRGLLGRDATGLRLAIMLVVGFLPAAVVGPLLEHQIKAHLFGPWPIVVGWLVGGIAIFFKSNNRGQESVTSTEGIRWQHALVIGLFQVTAMWPGVSRSLATIMGGMIAGLSIATAVEFSFLLGLITLGAATSYEMMHLGGAVVTAYGIGPSLTGIICSFIAAWLSVKWLLSYVRNRGLTLFGYYRILLAAVTALLLYSGVI